MKNGFFTLFCAGASLVLAAQISLASPPQPLPVDANQPQAVAAASADAPNAPAMPPVSQPQSSSPGCCAVPPPSCLPPGTIPPAYDPNLPLGAMAPSPAATDAFTAGVRGGTAASESARPNMFGDQLAQQVPGNLTATLPNGTVLILQRGPGSNNPTSQFPVGTVFNFDINIQTPQGSVVVKAGQKLQAPFPALLVGLTLPSFQSSIAAALAAQVAHGAYKITENESPRPQDRVFGTFNYFDNVGGNLNAANGLPQTNIYREVMGFEKAFLDGNASFGVRVPYLEVTGDGSLNRNDFGDISLIAKYAFINNRETGNVLSGGLVLTLPTGNNFLANGLPDIHSTVFQPYVGWIYNVSENFYVQGFTSIAVPTESEDITYLFNDFGIGYTVWQSCDRDRLLANITPIFETHITTPLNHRGSEVQPIGGIDVVDLTAGVTFGLRNGSSLNLGVVTPVTGPRPFDVEAQVQFNWRF